LTPTFIFKSSHSLLISIYITKNKKREAAANRINAERIFSPHDFGRIFWGASRPKKPGFPLQVLGFANANPAGFPLQSLARATA
jgi:hypothetical protein